MNHRFIPSHGIGEVFINGNYWEMLNSFFHNLKKEIPFFKLLLELGSLNMRVIIQGFDQEIDIYRKTLITDFRRKTTFLIESFTKIEDLCDDLYSTGHIELLVNVWQYFLNLLIMNCLTFLLKIILRVRK